MVSAAAPQKHWPNRRSGRQRNGHNSGGAGAVAR
jgi:hypothetical protein